MMETSSSKSRHQSKLEFVESLIKEYFVSEMRSKCYPSRIDRRYWSKVSKGKQARIKDICNDIGVPHIFEDESLMNNYKRLYYPIDGIPKLFENAQDERSYFCKGADVILRGENANGVGRIIAYDAFTKKVTVEVLPERREEVLVDNLVSRIF